MGLMPIVKISFLGLLLIMDLQKFYNAKIRQKRKGTFVAKATKSNGYVHGYK